MKRFRTLSLFFKDLLTELFSDAAATKRYIYNIYNTSVSLLFDSVLESSDSAAISDNETETPAKKNI